MMMKQLHSGAVECFDASMWCERESSKLDNLCRHIGPGFLGGVVRIQCSFLSSASTRRGLRAGLTFLAETQNFWVVRRVQPSSSARLNTNRHVSECGLEIIPQVNINVTVIVPLGHSSLSFVHLTQS